jgi:hypothetical protein
MPERCASAKNRCYEWNKGEIQSIEQRDRAKFKEIQMLSEPIRELTVERDDYSQ